MLPFLLGGRLVASVGAVGNGPLPTFDIGSPQFSDIWVDPSNGTDADGRGASRSAALRTLTEAWRRIPIGIALTQGYRINLVAGVHSIIPNYWENRIGTFATPIMIRAVDGVGTARLPTVNVFGCRHLYFEGLDIAAGGGDVLHFENSSKILLRNVTVRSEVAVATNGGTGPIAQSGQPVQETVKMNQCQYVYVEHCNIYGAWDNAVDFVAVQYGHVVGSKIHRAGDWAMYAKGGSAHLTIRGNEFYDAGTGGFTAGQGTGFEWMKPPWLQYEAYDIIFTDNVIHDTWGAGIGVNGGVNILMANNTMYRVGSRSHVIEVVFGGRSCDGVIATCTQHLAQGGWGTNATGVEIFIPNKNATIANNVVLNPSGYRSQWQHFTIHGPRTQTWPGSNAPSPAHADDGLQIFGNVIWNGPANHPLGVPSALEADVLSRNAINTFCPVLADPLNGDYQVVPGATCGPSSSTTSRPTTIRPTFRPSTARPASSTRSPTSRPTTIRPTSRPSTARPASSTRSPTSRPTSHPTTARPVTCSVEVQALLREIDDLKRQLAATNATK